MAQSGKRRRNNAPAVDSFRALELLEPAAVVGKYAGESALPTTPPMVLRPTTTVSGSQSILSSSNVSKDAISVSVVASTGTIPPGVTAGLSCRHPTADV